jgi:transcriptional regulator with AAA-type ATPase domain/tetratricopeptide (TPR) repeat protein
MDPLRELIGDSPPLLGLRKQIERLLSGRIGGQRLPPVFLFGETGTGKGLLARCLHRASARADSPFIDVNCAAIPETMLEAELFGFERGAFTDAKQAKPGLFQTAHRGTIFLDEIGLLSPGLQAKLLKVLEEKTVRRLGSTRNEAADVWAISATNEDLSVSIRERRFREDLYHRLAVITLSLPPLRERGEDIVRLAEHFCARASAEYHVGPRSLGPDARGALRTYPWPGNVRELSNVIERAVLLTDSPIVTAATLGLPAAPPPGMVNAPAVGKPARSRDERRREELRRVLAETDWNVTQTAESLRITRNTVRARIARYGLTRDGGDSARPAPPASRQGGGLPSVSVTHWERRPLAFMRLHLVSTSAVDTTRGLEAVSEKIHAFGGRIEETGPTDLIAVFGLEPVDNAPAHAALAALSIQNAAFRAKATGAGIADVVVALDCGPHVVARGPSGLHVGVDGKAAAWSALERLIADGAPGTVLATAAVAPLLRRRFGLRRLPPAEDGPCVVLGREDVPAATTRFVGRTRDLDTLERARGRAEGRNGEIVAIVGDAGTGKSRLVREFAGTLSGWRVLSCAGTVHGTNTAYAPVVDLLHKHCGIQDTDTPAAMNQKLATAWPRGAGDPSAGMPPLLDLLGVLRADDPFRELDPKERRHRTIETVTKLLLAVSAVQPLAVIVEDLHWIDSETQAVLDRLADAFATAPVLLIVNYRPSYRHGWEGRSHCTLIRLDPLPRDAVDQLLFDLLGPDPSLQTVKAALASRTEGNPFFLEESVRSLVDSSVLASSPDGYRLTRVIGQLEIPATVQAILASRIDRLEEADRQLLQAAAVIGPEVPYAILEAIAKKSDDELSAGLARLQTGGFLDPTRLFPEMQFAFKHALTHEVAYDGLLPAGRSALHASVVEAIRRVHGERLDEQVERLAHHAVRGERWDEAVTWSRRAAARAASRSAYAQAAAHLEEALAALDHLPVTRAVTEQAVDIRLELREMLVPLGEPARNLVRVEEALPLAASLGDPRRMARVYLSLATGHWALGDAVRGLGYAERALAAAEEVGDPLLRTRSHFATAVAHHSLGDYRRAIRACEATLALLDEEVAPRVRFGVYPVYARTWLAFCLADLGDFSRALAFAHEAGELARANGRPESLVTARAALGSVCHVRGDLAEAAEHFERGLTLCRESAIGVWLPSMTGGLGHVYALLGRPAEARQLLDECLASAAKNMRSAEPIRIAWLGEAHLLAGRLVEAREVAMRALELTRERQTRGAEAMACRLLGEVASKADSQDLEGARAHYGCALALADEIGMRPLIAHCHAGLGRLLLRMGKPHAAETHVATAAAMYREMGMAHGLEQAEPARPSVPEPSS